MYQLVLSDSLTLITKQTYCKQNLVQFFLGPPNTLQY